MRSTTLWRLTTSFGMIVPECRSFYYSSLIPHLAALKPIPNVGLPSLCDMQRLSLFRRATGYCRYERRQLRLETWVSASSSPRLFVIQCDALHCR